MSKSLIINKLPKAERDLLCIWSYTARHWGEQKADEYLDELLSTLNRVALHPSEFPLKTDFKPAVRMALCNRHVLICKTDDLSVTLIRVMHQSANIQAYLNETKISEP